MARYEVLIKPSARKELEAVGLKKDRQRIVAGILALAENPRQVSCHKLSGKDEYRVRCGEYRAVYSVEAVIPVVTIVKVGHRRDVRAHCMVANGLHRNSLDKVYEVLQLPASSCFPLATVVLGYPRQEPPYQKGRLDLDAVVHRGEYRAHTEAELDEIVAQYDDPSRHIGMIPNWQEQGFRHYLDWFYTKWTGKPATERVATGKVLEFQQQLAKSGFWWPEA